MDRRSEILKAIVEHFVQTAEPVGSQTILVSYKFSVSPATIRNDMAFLEKGADFQCTLLPVRTDGPGIQDFCG